MHGEARQAGKAAESLWRFSLAFYSRPGVAEALVHLQDEAGCDVNLVLFALWAAAVRGRALDDTDLAAADAAAARVRAAAVAPLRRLRRAIDPADDPDLRHIRARLLLLELAAERRVQRRLAASLGAVAEPHDIDRLAAAVANLRSYLGPETAGRGAAAAIMAALTGFLRRP